jgi:hypothetical protein
LFSGSRRCTLKYLQKVKIAMDALIIKSENRSDLKLIKELVKKMGLESKSLSEEEIEDLGIIFRQFTIISK